MKPGASAFWRMRLRSNAPADHRVIVTSGRAFLKAVMAASSGLGQFMISRVLRDLSQAFSICRLSLLYRPGNLRPMTVTIQNLFSAAMSLDADSRRDLAERLWDTVQPQDESVFSEATWQEIGRRVAASDAGQVEHVAGDVALAQVRAEHGLTSS